MSAEDNVKIVQEKYRAFLRRDVPGILVHLDDDIIWTVPGSEISFPKRGRKAKKAALPPGSVPIRRRIAASRRRRLTQACQHVGTKSPARLPRNRVHPGVLLSSTRHGQVFLLHEIKAEVYKRGRRQRAAAWIPRPSRAARARWPRDGRSPSPLPP
jgi:hypothetical protein